METGCSIGIPDIDLPLLSNGNVNPSHFIGHGLVVRYCPRDKDAAAREMADYANLIQQLPHEDAYMIAICTGDPCDPAGKLMVATDPDGRAWSDLSRGLPPDGRDQRNDGAVFLFGRGGCLVQAWHGPGHAKDVASALAQRM